MIFLNLDVSEIIRVKEAKGVFWKADFDHIYRFYKLILNTLMGTKNVQQAITLDTLKDNLFLYWTQKENLEQQNSITPMSLSDFHLGWGLARSDVHNLTLINDKTNKSN